MARSRSASVSGVLENQARQFERRPASSQRPSSQQHEKATVGKQQPATSRGLKPHRPRGARRRWSRKPSSEKPLIGEVPPANHQPDQQQASGGPA